MLSVSRKYSTTMDYNVLCVVAHIVLILTKQMSAAVVAAASSKKSTLRRQIDSVCRLFLRGDLHDFYSV